MDVKRAQEVSDKLLERLAKKLDQAPCLACGAIEMTAAEMNVLRQMLKDNEFQGIEAGEPSYKMDSVKAVPFPQDKAAHG